MQKITEIHDKFLLSSLLQKSIRLGISSATRHSIDTLYHLDKNYLMYRLMIVAFEDIGAANLDLLKKITTFRWGVRNFKERNIDFLEYCQTLGQELCVSAKDRSACDSVYLLKKAYIYDDLDAVLSHPILANVYQSWQTLGFGRYVFDDTQPKSTEPDHVDSFIEQVNLLTHKDHAYLSQFYSTQVEPFFLSIPFLHADLEKNLISTDKLTTNFSEEDEFVWSAIDGHTRIGAASLQQLIKENLKSFNEVLRLPAQEDLYKVLKMLLFRVEGQNIENKVNYPSAQLIKNLTQRKEQAYYFPFITWDQYMKAGQVLKQLLPELHKIRAQHLKHLLAQEPPTQPIKKSPSL